MADDKKDYKTMLKIMDSTATLPSLQNKLTELAIDADDPQLKQAADKLAGWLRSAILKGGKGPQRIMSMATVLAASPLATNVARGKAIKSIYDYSAGAVAAAMPAWQIVARKEGWSSSTPADGLREDILDAIRLVRSSLPPPGAQAKDDDLPLAEAAAVMLRHLGGRWQKDDPELSAAVHGLLHRLDHAPPQAALFSPALPGKDFQ